MEQNRVRRGTESSEERLNSSRQEKRGRINSSRREKGEQNKLDSVRQEKNEAVNSIQTSNEINRNITKENHQSEISDNKTQNNQISDTIIDNGAPPDLFSPRGVANTQSESTESQDTTNTKLQPDGRPSSRKKSRPGTAQSKAHESHRTDEMKSNIIAQMTDDYPKQQPEAAARPPSSSNQRPASSHQQRPPSSSNNRPSSRDGRPKSVMRSCADQPVSQVI